MLFRDYVTDELRIQFSVRGFITTLAILSIVTVGLHVVLYLYDTEMKTRRGFEQWFQQFSGQHGFVVPGPDARQ